MMQTHVAGLFIGRPQMFKGAKQSAIARHPVDRAIFLRHLGFDGDEVADRKHHGGIDKAVHLYPVEHYPFWRERIGAHPLLENYGAFGENIAAAGLTEGAVRIGDRLRIGKALVEISHGRQPCWKLDQRFGRDDIMRTIVKTGRCGLYLRVIEEGEVASDDRIEMVARGDDRWTVERVFALLIQPRAERDKAALELLVALETLAATWRARARKLADA